MTVREFWAAQPKWLWAIALMAVAIESGSAILWRLRRKPGGKGVNARLGPLFFRSALIAVGVTAAVWLGRRYRRFAISGQSMLPTLAAGDWVLVDERAYRSKLPLRGHIVIARDPRQLDRHIVKRVVSVDLHGEIRLEGDNPEESTDSRQFGPVSAPLIQGRVRWRYWPAPRFGSIA
jgi:nickel-type superoxide dismutase maturation protease